MVWIAMVEGLDGDDGRFGRWWWRVCVVVDV